ncbi:hypothetical protein ACVC7V_21540 [Hydrogenophaga sp. A37]
MGSPSNAPVRRKLHLHNQRTGRLVAEQWSGRTDGAHQFFGVAAATYYVITFDHTGEYNGEVTTDIVVPPPPAP